MPERTDCGERDPFGEPLLLPVPEPLPLPRAAPNSIGIFEKDCICFVVVVV
jgi:hypothetical protein